MPSKKVKIGIGVVVSVLAMLVAPLLFGSTPMQTSYSKTPTGHRAVFDLLSEFRDVQRWRRTPLSLQEHSSKSSSQHALVMIEPVPDLLSEGVGYQNAILAWVRAGNDLVVVPRVHDAKVADVVGREFESHKPTSNLGSGLELLLDEAGLTGEIERDWAFDSGSPRRTFRTASGDEIHVPFLMELKGSGSEFETVLAAAFDSEPEQPLVVDAKVGEGRIAIVLAPGLFWNHAIAEGDNGFVVLEILSEYGRDGILIDEYYHGLTAVDGFRRLLLTAPMLWVTLSFLFLSLLVTWRSLVRSEPISLPPMPSRRSKREHIDAMGRLIATSKDDAWIVRRVLDGLQVEVRECLRLDPSASLETVLDFLGRSDEALAGRLESLVASAPRISKGRASQAAAVAWGRQSHAFLRDLHGARKAGARSHGTAPHPLNQ